MNPDDYASFFRSGSTFPPGSIFGHRGSIFDECRYPAAPPMPPKPILEDVEMIIDGHNVTVAVERSIVDGWRRKLEADRVSKAWQDAQDAFRASQERARRARTQPTSQPFTTTGDAITYLRTIAGTDTTDLKKLARRAKRLTHPDLGGNPDDFRRVTDAENLLRGARRL